MQQSLIEAQAYLSEQQDEYRARRGRPFLMKPTQWFFIVILIGLDISCTWLAYYSSHAIIQRSLEEVSGPFLNLWPLPAIYTIILLAVFFHQQMYQRRRSTTHLDEIFKTTVLCTFALLLTVAVLALAIPDFEYDRIFLAYALGLNIGFLTLARIIHAQVQWQAQAQGISDDRVIIIGTGEIGQMLIQKISQNPTLGYHVLGLVSADKRDSSQYIQNTPVLGALVDIPWIIERFDVDEVIIGLPESSHSELVNIISLCEREKVGIRVFPDVFQIMASEVSIGDLGGLPLLNIRDVALQGWRLALKRGMDIVLSTFGLIVTSPFLLITALLVKLESPGPVFYTQERMGLDAKPFKIIKFRSMHQNAESNGPGWTQEDDPRRTKLGTSIRRFEIDELPQLINILIGDPSLYGSPPREGWADRLGTGQRAAG